MKSDKPNAAGKIHLVQWQGAIKLPLDGKVTILGIGLLGCLLSYFTLYIDVQTKVCCRCFLNAIQELVASVGTTAELRMGF